MSKKNILIVAPHADDETLGCGGTILKLLAKGYSVHWLLVTGMSSLSGYKIESIDKRSDEIAKVTASYGFTSVTELGFPPAQLETLPKGDIIQAISSVICDIQPEQIFTAYRNDAHSDHEIVYDAVMAATKSFRYPFVKRVLAYETISETDFATKPEDGGFKPNVFIDIEPYIEMKLEILKIFESEIGIFPFPRSLEALNALAMLRGVQCNAKAAEAFMLIKGIE